MLKILPLTLTYKKFDVLLFSKMSIVIRKQTITVWLLFSIIITDHWWCTFVFLLFCNLSDVSIKADATQLFAVMRGSSLRRVQHIFIFYLRIEYLVQSAFSLFRTNLNWSGLVIGRFFNELQILCICESYLTIIGNHTTLKEISLKAVDTRQTNFFWYS